MTSIKPEIVQEKIFFSTNFSSRVKSKQIFVKIRSLLKSIKRKINGQKYSNSEEDSVLLSSEKNTKRELPDLCNLAQRMMRDLTKRQERLEEKFNLIYIKSDALRKELKELMCFESFRPVKAVRKWDTTNAVTHTDKENNANAMNCAPLPSTIENTILNVVNRDELFNKIVDNYGLNNVKTFITECVQRFPSLLETSEIKKRENNGHNFNKLKRKRSASTQGTSYQEHPSFTKECNQMSSSWFEEANSLLPFLNNSPNTSPIRLRKKQSTLCANEELKPLVECPIEIASKPENNPFDSLISAQQNLRGLS